MFIMNSYMAFIITSHYSKFFSNINFPLQQLFEGVIHYCYQVSDVWKLTNAKFKWFFQCSQLINDRTEVYLMSYHLKSRDITLPMTVCIVKALIFPVVIYGCECWTIKKAERQRINDFELWCWRWLRVLGLQGDQTSQSKRKWVLNIHFGLKLKLQHSDHLMQRAGSLEKTLVLGKIEGRRGMAEDEISW